MSKIYLQVEGKTGRVYEYSKTAKEGFEEHTSSNSNVSYRKYYNKGVFGTLLNVGVRESKIGEQLIVSLKNGNDFVNLQFALYDQNGNIENRYAESLIRFLPVLKKGEGYRFYPYAIEPEGDEKYPRYGVSVVSSANPENEEVGEKVEPYLTYSKEPSKDTDIPKAKWKMVAGKNKMIADDKNEFLYNHLKSAVDGHLAYEGSSNTSQTTSKPSNDLPKPSAEEAFPPNEEEDDLPF